MVQSFPGSSRTVLMIHNYYQQPGGEDECFTAEAELLSANGHRVLKYSLHNDEIRRAGRAKLAQATIWNRDVYRDLSQIIAEEKPELLHCHNIFPLISPAAYYAARRQGIPVLQTIHNYRLLCLNAQFLRDGRPCEDCLGTAGCWSGLMHRCYRDDFWASLGVASMLVVHRRMRTWSREIDTLVAVSKFAKSKLVAGGFDARRIRVKPHFLPNDPGIGSSNGGYALYVGRLSEEKGVGLLIEAWKRLPIRFPLKLAGDGPLMTLQGAVSGIHPEIDFLGRKTRSDIFELMRNAACLIVPSLCYETFGRSVIEAFACGTPVVVSDGGALAELVEPEWTGLHFETGNPEALKAQVMRLMLDADLSKRVRKAARAKYESRFTSQSNYLRLMRIYNATVAGFRKTRGSGSESAHHADAPGISSRIGPETLRCNPQPGEDV